MSLVYIRVASASCLTLLRHELCCALARARAKTGNRIAAKIAMM